MIEARNTPELQASTPSRTSRRRTLSRLATASAIVIASLTAAAPSWAGPMTGC